MTRPALVVRDGRHPFQVAVLTAGVVIGGFGLIGPQMRSAAIDLAWGGVASAVWYLLVGAFSLIGLWAVLAPRAENRNCARLVPTPRWLAPMTLRRSLQVERLAMYGFGWPMVAFLPAALASSGLAGATAGTVFLALGIATGIRIRQIHVDLRKLDGLKQRGTDHTQVVADPDLER